MMEIEVREATLEWLDEICQFRVTVWRETGALAEEAFPGGEWRDESDAHAQHWIALSSGKLVGAARLAIYDRVEQLPECEEYTRYGLSFAGRIAAPDRVVVSPRVGGQGVGGKLVDSQEAAWLATDAVAAVRQASPAMCRLIEKRGWRLVGPATKDARFPGIDFTVAMKERPTVNQQQA